MRKLLTNVTIVLASAFLITIIQPVVPIQIDGSSVIQPLTNGMET